MPEPLSVEFWASRARQLGRMLDERDDRLDTLRVALDAERAKNERLQIETVEGVLDLMRAAGTLQEQPDTIIPHANGYSCWFVARGQIGTAPLRAEEIVRRINALKALAAVPDGPVSEEKP